MGQHLFCPLTISLNSILPPGDIYKHHISQHVQDKLVQIQQFSPQHPGLPGRGQEGLLECRFGCILLQPEAATPVTLRQKAISSPQQWVQEQFSKSKWCCDMLSAHYEHCGHIHISVALCQCLHHKHSPPLVTMPENTLRVSFENTLLGKLKIP